MLPIHPGVCLSIAPGTLTITASLLSPPTMKLFILVVCTFHLIVAQHQAADRSTHCESCLITAREIEKVLRDSPADARQPVLRRLLAGEVCERPVFHNHQVASRDTLTACCKQLLEGHHEEFSEALLHGNPKHMEITLCYEQSHTCVGVKRQSFQNPKDTFKDDLDALIQSNKGNMRISRPIRSKEEL